MVMSTGKVPLAILTAVACAARHVKFNPDPNTTGRHLIDHSRGLRRVSQFSYISHYPHSFNVGNLHSLSKMKPNPIEDPIEDPNRNENAN